MLLDETELHFGIAAKIPMAFSRRRAPPAPDRAGGAALRSRRLERPVTQPVTCVLPTPQSQTLPASYAASRAGCPARPRPASALARCSPERATASRLNSAVNSRRVFVAIERLSRPRRGLAELSAGSAEDQIIGFADDGSAAPAQNQPRDPAWVDGRRGLVAVAQAASPLPSAQAAPRLPGRADPDRWQRALLVRGSRRAMYLARLHRPPGPASRAGGQACATGRLMQLLFVPSESCFSYFEALQGYLETHRSGASVRFRQEAGGLAASRRAPGRLLLRQALGVPGSEEGRQGWSGHDPVRSRPGRAQYRDLVRQLEPGNQRQSR